MAPISEISRANIPTTIPRARAASSATSPPTISTTISPQAIEPLKDGDISDVVRTKYGFHIVKVEEHEMPGLQPLDDVKNIIRDKMMTEQAQGKFQNWIDQDLKRHYVETSH